MLADSLSAGNSKKRRPLATASPQGGPRRQETWKERFAKPIQ